MRSRAGFTLIEAVVAGSIAGLLVILVLILMPSLPDCREDAGRTMCGTRLRGLYVAIGTYSVSNRDAFPMLGKSDPAASAFGFGEGDRSTGRGAKLDNNVTANLWVIVKDGSVSPKNFICPEDATAEEDFLTLDGKESGIPVDLRNTNDFSFARSLSYSVMNMHHAAFAKHWNPNASADQVLMADDNDNNAAVDRHTFSKGAPIADVTRAENSSHHKGEGQNLQFGDGHVSFDDDPFVGPGGDNVFAMTVGGKNVPPTFGNSDGDAATDPALADRDAVLLPITGNGGGAGSLDPAD